MKYMKDIFMGIDGYMGIMLVYVFEWLVGLLGFTPVGQYISRFVLSSHANTAVSMRAIVWAY